MKTLFATAALLSTLVLAAPAALAQESAAPPSRAPSPTGELNPASFVRNSLVALQFMVEAGALAEERPLSEETAELARVMARANRGLALDLVAAMEAAGRPVPADLRRLVAEPGLQRTPATLPLEETLSRRLAELAATPDERFERAWLQVMANGLESAERWWSRYGYRSETDRIGAYAAAALPTIRTLAVAVQRARL